MEQPRNQQGQYISLEKFVMQLMDERFSGLRRELAQEQKALRLQAEEYERRLKDLNHAHARAQEALNTFVRIDKYEDQMESEAEARKLALDRLDEKLRSLDRNINQKLDDYITKVEARQAEIDQAIALGKGATQEATRAAEEQGRKSDAQARELARRTNRNMTILGIGVAIFVAVINYLGGT